ncbi:MAG: hypothetical protein RL277_1882 [Planctomycetota bacterium]|jgi:tRNA pseudouridine13 synthase
MSGIKFKPQDFRVRELLDPEYLRPSGKHRVYRVKKRKRTSLEAAQVLAELVGVPAAEVGMAGLKDRQAVTLQYMSVPVRREVHLNERDIVIEPAGFASEPLSSAHSLGNGFEITVRGISPRELSELDAHIESVREHGVVNYFGEQRFGNLRFAQGWIALDLMQGKPERALKSLICGVSEQDDEIHARFKHAFARTWGEWRECRDIAGKFGSFHSVFEHLARNPEDFAGAFTYVSSRLRLIHLYAWQSHLWNRTVANYVREVTPKKDLLMVDALEGRLNFSRGALPLDPELGNNWRLPGPRLEDVTAQRTREMYTKALELEGLSPEQFEIEGVSGFQLKGEDRELLIRPRKLKAEPDGFDREGQPKHRVCFELPRGSYATMVLARLFPLRGERPHSDSSDFGPGRPTGQRREQRPGFSRDRRGEDRRDDRRPFRPNR